MPVNLDIKLQAKQFQAFTTEATEVLYGGAAGGGKSHLMRAASVIWALDIPRLQIYLFRRTSPELKTNHLDGPTGYAALLEDLVAAKSAFINYSKNTISFVNGSVIHLCHCQYEKDVYKYQGAEIHVLMVDELTHFTETIYKYLRGRVRLGGLPIPEKYRGQFPRILCGSNPGGPGHNVFKNMFVNGRPPMKIEKMTTDEGGMRRQYIPAKLDDNKILINNDPSYRDRLLGLGNKNLTKALLDGNWDIVAGGAFDDLFDYDTHVYDPFEIPEGYEIFRAYDHGTSSPFSVLWLARADGNDDFFLKNDLIVINEFYGADAKGAGLNLPATEIARRIKDIETLNENSNIPDLVKKAVSRTEWGVADSAIFTRLDGRNLDGTDDSVAKRMAEEGIYWEPCKKGPNSRQNRFEVVRDRLAAGIGHRERPGLFFFSNCVKLIEHLPVLPRDKKNPDDVDTDADDHDYDALAYGCAHQRKELLTGSWTQ